jgi:hypothetical protein
MAIILFFLQPKSLPFLLKVQIRELKQCKILSRIFFETNKQDCFLVIMNLISKSYKAIVIEQSENCFYTFSYYKKIAFFSL